MLSKHRVMSPATRRIAGTATLALVVVALGATASGTQAAETIRSGVEHVTGVEIAQVERSAQHAAAAVLAPVAAVAQAAPPTPPAIPATTPTVPSVEPLTRDTVTDTDGKRRQVIVRRVSGEGPMTDAQINAIIAATPEVIERKCGIDGADRRQITLNERDGTRMRMVICTDRAEHIGAEAARSAVAGRKLTANLVRPAGTEAAQSAATGRAAARAGLAAALSGLRAARQTIVMQQGLTADQRDEAVAGIDEGIAEIEQEIAGEG